MPATVAFRFTALVAACLLAAGCTASRQPAAVGASAVNVSTTSGAATGSPAASAAGSGPASARSAAPSGPTPTRTLKVASPTTAPPATPPATASATGTHAASGPCASASACGFPDASTTGPRIKALTPHSGDIEVQTDGQVISGWDLKGSLDVYASNVTIVDSRITSTNWWGVNLRKGATGLKILHTTIVGTTTKGIDSGGTDYGVSANTDGSLEVGWCDISQFGAAVSTGHGDVHDNYTHNQAAFTVNGAWVHTDAIISSGADPGGLVIRHNTLINEDAIDKGASASVGLFDDDGPVTNTTVDDNWLAGGSYAFYGGDAGATGIKVTNNVFSKQVDKNGGYYGFVAHWNAGGAGNVWSGNRTSDGAVVTP